MAVKMARKRQTTAPTSRRMGRGAPFLAFFAFFVFFAPAPLAAAGFFAPCGLRAPVFLLAGAFFAPPELDAIVYQQSFQKTSERMIVSTPAPRQ